MTKLNKLVRATRAEFEKIGLSGDRLHYELLIVVQRHKIAILARKAFDDGVPLEEGTVWFDDEQWKTDFWRRQWEWQKAYREGEEARASFADRDSNPYQQEKLPFTSRMIELSLLWNKGFDGDEL
jgi:hypothetical protein